MEYFNIEDYAFKFTTQTFIIGLIVSMAEMLKFLINETCAEMKFYLCK